MMGTAISTRRSPTTRKQSDTAIVDFDEVVRLDPTDAYAFQERGGTYLKKGDKAKAKADFAQVKKLGYKGK